MRKPNLFIIGAMKAGTTSLHSYLGAHPDIFMSPVKEPAFFVDPAEEGPDKAGKTGYWNDPSLYLQLFEEAGDQRFVGESTTDYTKLPKKTGVARRILDFSRDARFIYVVRDPIDRTLSHYWWEVQAGFETRDILTAIRDDPFYRQVSDYAMQLAPYLELAGRQRVKVVTFEALTVNPRKVLQDIFAWLGVDAQFVPPNVAEKLNVTPGEVTQLKSRGALQRLRYSRVWDVIGPWTPKALRRVGRSLVERRINRRSVRLDEVVEFLRPIQTEQAARLGELLGQDFPEWVYLRGAMPASAV
jgi:Sulfotransferase family